MPIGDRRYEVVDDAQRPAEGPPFLQATLLLCDFAYELLSTLQQWGPKLDAASGEPILVVTSGESKLSGVVYRKLRTAAKAKSDDAGDRVFRKRLIATSDPARAATHLNTENAFASAERLGVQAHELPCIVWSTYPNIRPPLITRIKPEWCATKQAQGQFASEFVLWLERTRLQGTWISGLTVFSVRKDMAARIRELSRAIDRVVGIKPKANKLRGARRATATVVLSDHSEVALRSDKPGSLEFNPESGRRSAFITRTQLFYLSAFLLGGKRVRSADGQQIRVTEIQLTNRLPGWQRAGLRETRSKISQEPKYQISKDWKRFARKMNDRLGSDEWFIEKILGKDDGKRFYACWTESVELKIKLVDRRWLREQLISLTGQE